MPEPDNRRLSPKTKIQNRLDLSLQDLATLGADTFNNAAFNYSASIACQATYVLLESRKLKLFPAVLGGCLLRNDDQLLRIQRAANTAHDRKNEKQADNTADNSNQPEIVIHRIEIEGKDGIRDFVEQVFQLAQRMTIFSNEELANFLIDPPRGIDRIDQETALRRRIEMAITEKTIRRQQLPSDEQNRVGNVAAGAGLVSA